ncbi:hypothetical protein D3C71_1514940 [compost metagenome]
MRSYESLNILYLQTTVSPSIYQSEDLKHLKLSLYSEKYSDDTDDRPSDLPNTFKELGCITTDLWAVTLTDYGDFINLIGGEEALKLNDNYVIIEVPNGSYTCKYMFMGEDEDSHSWDCCFAEFVLKEVL